MNQPTSTVKIPTTNKDMVKAYLVGTGKNIGDFYAEAALKLINNGNSKTVNEQTDTQPDSFDQWCRTDLER